MCHPATNGMEGVTDSRSWLIRGGHIVDPATGRDGVADLLIRDGRIAEIGAIGDADGACEFAAHGLVVAPGLVDVHVHLREPGFERKETIATGTAAAAAGGFTTICCMPNTAPALDSVAVLDELRQRVAHEGHVKVHPIAAISKGRAGKEAVDFAALAEAGAIGFSDDGDTTADSGIMRRALDASAKLNRPVMVHCEDRNLATGHMNEGEVSRRLGIEGIPAEAEEIIIARDTLLAKMTGGWLHVCHVSTGYGAEIVRRAKRDGVHVTAEVMPHHLVMDDEWIAGSRTLLNVDEPAGTPGQPGDPNTKVNPPLRTRRDTELLLTALQDGAIDIIATDHAPHEPATKAETAFDRAANGLSGLEFALPLLLGLVRAGKLTMSGLILRLSMRPARLLRQPVGTLAIGSPADLVIFDPAERWVVTPEKLKTKHANTPLIDMELQGRVKLTLVNGEERHRA